MIIHDNSRIEEATETRIFHGFNQGSSLHVLEIDPWILCPMNHPMGLPSYRASFGLGGIKKLRTMEPHKSWSHRISISRDVEVFLTPKSGPVTSLEAWRATGTSVSSVSARKTQVAGVSTFRELLHLRLVKKTF